MSQSQAVSNFINAIIECFPEEIVSRPQYSHIDEIMMIFKEWIVTNKDLICVYDYINLSPLIFDSKTTWKFQDIFNHQAGRENKDIIWAHLSKIVKIMIPGAEIKEIVKEPNEKDFITGLVSKIQNQMEGKDYASPIEAIQDLIGGMIADLPALTEQASKFSPEKLLGLTSAMFMDR